MNTRLLLLLFFASHSLVANPSERTIRDDAHHQIISHIPRERVGSSAIVSVGYSKRLHILEIEFTNGRIYRYLEVPIPTYRELVSASSKAAYYDTNIKGRFVSLHVRPRVKGQGE